MTESRDLLVEIGTEELPPGALKNLSRAFRDAFREALAQAGLGHGDLHAYATPRRLALLVHALATAQPDSIRERRGPALAAAFDSEGCVTQAAAGFARSCGVAVEQLEKQETDKGAWLVYREALQGRAVRELIPAMVHSALDALPIPRRMRWGSSGIQFVRPVHWVVLLFGEELIEADILGVPSSRETRGHRFHHPAPLYIAEPAAYAPLLETEGHVVADFEDRAEAIRAQVEEAAVRLGGHAVIDADLLDEVTAMVEWPVTVAGDFDARFLEVPPEVLTTTMKVNQKYFHVINEAGELMPHFITVSNIDSRDIERVRAGNERVIRPRLADADFFWNQDRSHGLIERLDDLKNVVFQDRLGTLYDKTCRLCGAAGQFALNVGAEPAPVERAALLCKCDLMTEMVGEFPDLQGIMGRYYASHDGEPAATALAIDEHYMPRHAGDALPQTTSGQILAVADRLDSLVGLFGIGQPPSGDKDPFALRRAALGVLRILIEQQLDLDLEEILDIAIRQYTLVAEEGGVFTDEGASSATREQVFAFMMERLRSYYQDREIAPDVFEAVLAQRPTRPVDFDARIRAVSAFRRLPEAQSLAAANKRISNILRQAVDAIPDEIDPGLLHEEAEQALTNQLTKLQQQLKPVFGARDYTAAMQALASLRGPVDRFFDSVLVMDPNKALRNNRLALLNRLRNLFLRVADLSRLQS